MTPKTPTEDIRAARHTLAARFDNDLDRIVADLRRQQRESGVEYIKPARRSLPQADTTSQSAHPSTVRGRESA
jgi:hypothetical protein